RTAIFFGTPKERARTILVTSPAQGDGKSTLASNLAIAMAQAGQRTILLDADFRRPVQHTIFEIEPDENGLSAVLAGRQKLAHAIQHTQVAGLEVIPAGLRVPNPAEILNSPRFGILLDRLSGTYDRIIVDAPPVTVVTDAQIIGAICGITVLVLRADKSTKKIGERAIDALHRVGANLIGAVVNDVRRNGDRYGYYGHYGGSEGSGRAGRRIEKVRDVERDKNRLQPAVGATVKGGS
ncbi:MAG: CpsD/CapB family tyrosine-protein kinase, partial [Phycisphaerales bacterium]